MFQAETFPKRICLRPSLYLQAEPFPQGQPVWEGWLCACDYGNSREGCRVTCTTQITSREAILQQCGRVLEDDSFFLLTICSLVHLFIRGFVECLLCALQGRKLSLEMSQGRAGIFRGYKSLQSGCLLLQSVRTNECPGCQPAPHACLSSTHSNKAK